MEAPITRRDFLGSALLASGAVLLGPITPAELLAGQDEFTGYGGVATLTSTEVRSAKCHASLANRTTGAISAAKS